MAVLAVVCFHAFPGLLPGGFAGVDIFFVISGFLISGILLAETGEGKLSIAAFYGRRVRRIFPGLILMFSATLAAGWCVLSSVEWKALGGDAAAGAAFVSNLRLWGEAGYFDRASASKPLLHLWSLGIEEQFYILWPLVVLLAARRKKVFAILLPGLTVASLAAGIWLTMQTPDAAFYLPYTRFWELLAGALLAANRERLTPSPVRGWIGTGLIAVSVLALNPEMPFPGWAALLPVAGATLLISAGNAAWPNRHLFGQPVMVFIGLISYPLYLWHWPVLTFTRLLTFDSTPAWLSVVAVAASAALAWLTWRFAERSVRHASGSLLTVVLCSLVAMFAVIGMMIDSGRFSVSDPLERVHRSMRNGVGLEGLTISGCGMDPTERVPEYCRSDSREAPALALMGDSHAGALFPALVRRSIAGKRWMLAGQSNCIPALGMVRTGWRDRRAAEGCASDTVRVVRAVAVNRAIGTVVIAVSARVTGTLEPRLSEGPPLRYNASVTDGLSRTISALRSAGKRVVIVVDNPSLPDPWNCLRAIRWFGILTNPACVVSRNQANEDYRGYRGLIAEVTLRNPELEIFDPTHLLCPDDECRVINGGISWYSYTDHLSDAGADMVAHSLIGQLN